MGSIKAERSGALVGSVEGVPSGEARTETVIGVVEILDGAVLAVTPGVLVVNWEHLQKSDDPVATAKAIRQMLKSTRKSSKDAQLAAECGRLADELRLFLVARDVHR